MQETDIIAIKNMRLSNIADYSYVSNLLEIFFGTEILGKSSAYGSKSNDHKYHEPLSSSKLRFVQGEKCALAI